MYQRTDKSNKFIHGKPVSAKKLTQDFLGQLTSLKLKTDTWQVVDALYGVYEARGKLREQFFPYPFDAVQKSGVDTDTIPLILNRLITPGFIWIMSSIKATPEELEQFPEHEKVQRKWKQVTIYDPYILPPEHVSLGIRMGERFELLHKELQQEMQRGGKQTEQAGSAPQPLAWDSKKKILSWDNMQSIDLTQHFAVTLFLDVLSRKKGKELNAEMLKREYNAFGDINHEQCVREGHKHCKRYKKTYTDVSVSRTADSSLKVLLNAFNVANDPHSFPIQNRGSVQRGKVIWLKNTTSKSTKTN